MTQIHSKTTTSSSEAKRRSRGILSKYHIHTRLIPSGRLKHRDILEAKNFLIEQFPELKTATHLTDSSIQQALIRMMKSGSRLAEICLRCYISNAAQSACLDLVQKFRLHPKISLSELLSRVLDDVYLQQPLNHSPSYIPFALKVLHTFDPNKGSLNCWTRRLVGQHPELNQLLSEHGIYIASDWAILNQSSPSRVRRLLFSVLTDQELQRACTLLDSFHSIYRADRLQHHCSMAGKRCLDPGEGQIQRMIESLQVVGISVTSFQLLKELGDLATHLRRAKIPPSTSLNQIDCSLPIEQSSPSSEELFLAKYHQASENCLLRAIQQVLQQRFTQLQSHSPEHAEKFSKALYLFFVQGKPMSQIAPLVGLKHQFQVTRLLKLKPTRALISQQYVLMMQAQLQSIMADTLSPLQFAQLQLKPLLTEMSEQLIAEDVTECYSPHRRSRSLFSICICRFLKSDTRVSAVRHPQQSWWLDKCARPRADILDQRVSDCC